MRIEQTAGVLPAEAMSPRGATGEMASAQVTMAAEDVVIYGTVAEFTTPEDLIVATKKTTDAGYSRIDTYAPFPVEGLSAAMKFRDYKVPFLMLLGGICGGTGGFFFELWSFTTNYPYNIGGRALDSWPYFIVVAFELTILLTAFFGVFGMIILNGLPMPYHPIFNTPNFERASTDRFFLAVESRDPMWDLLETRAFMEGLGGINVSEVAEDDPAEKKKIRGDSEH